MFFFPSFVFLKETPNQVVNCVTANLATTSGVIVRSCNNELISELQFPTSNQFNNTAKEIMTGDTNFNSFKLKSFIFLKETSNQEVNFADGSPRSDKLRKLRRKRSISPPSKYPFSFGRAQSASLKRATCGKGYLDAKQQFFLKKSKYYYKDQFIRTLKFSFFTRVFSNKGALRRPMTYDDQSYPIHPPVGGPFW